MKSFEVLLVGALGSLPLEFRPRAVSDQASGDCLFSASSPGTRGAADDKALQTLIAEYALAGYELIDEVGIGGARRLYAIRNGQTQHLEDIDAARALLPQIAAHQ